jgi:hypothetical protein
MASQVVLLRKLAMGKKYLLFTRETPPGKPETSSHEGHQGQEEIECQAPCTTAASYYEPVETCSSGNIFSPQRHRERGEGSILTLSVLCVSAVRFILWLRLYGRAGPFVAK